MRLRTFTAASISEAMAQVRRELGPDAIIIATQERADGGVSIRAAAEEGAVQPSKDSPQLATRRREAERTRGRGDHADGITRIARALAWHDVPDSAAEAIMDAAISLEEAEPTATLARALDARYAVHPVEVSPARPILFAGAPGAGKSSAMARLAARAVSQGVTPLLVSCDQRAGASAQMQTYAKALQLDFEAAPGARELDLVLDGANGRPVFIDTGGVNPFDLEALESLTYLAATADAEIVAVMEAGQIPADAEDAAALFASIGAARVIFTRLDIARRMGALLAAGEAGFSYAHIAASPFIGSGLAPATPLRLARALLEDPHDDSGEDGPEEAAS